MSASIDSVQLLFHDLFLVLCQYVLPIVILDGWQLVEYLRVDLVVRLSELAGITIAFASCAYSSPELVQLPTSEWTRGKICSCRRRPLLAVRC